MRDTLDGWLVQEVRERSFIYRDSLIRASILRLLWREKNTVSLIGLFSFLEKRRKMKTTQVENQKEKTKWGRDQQRKTERPQHVKMAKITYLSPSCDPRTDRTLKRERYRWCLYYIFPRYHTQKIDGKEERNDSSFLSFSICPICPSRCSPFWEMIDPLSYTWNHTYTLYLSLRWCDDDDGGSQVDV